VKARQLLSNEIAPGARGRAGGSERLDRRATHANWLISRGADLARRPLDQAWRCAPSTRVDRRPRALRPHHGGDRLSRVEVVFEVAHQPYPLDERAATLMAENLS
jgi:hypothetical protein